MKKKAEMGIGTLIIFISLLLVAAIAAGVLIQTSGSLQEKALMTGDQARSQISTNVDVVEVSATDGRNGTLKQFTQILKLSPGSDEVKMDQMIVTINTYDQTLTLRYAGNSATTQNDANGYYSWDIETVNINSAPGNDYDLDGTSDNVTGGQNGQIIWLNISGAGPGIELGSCNAGGSFNNTLANKTYVKEVSAVCSGNDATSVTLTPTNVSAGVFSAEYLQEGSNFITGNIQRGDVVKLYYEAPANIQEAEKIRINVIPKVGTPTLTEFITPEVISTERVYLYP